MVELAGGPAKERKKRYSFYDSFFFQDIMDMIGSRVRPFDTPSSRWRSLDLTYRISKYPSASKMSKKIGPTTDKRGLQSVEQCNRPHFYREELWTCTHGHSL
eukprot:TRINITY_DN21377_c0_g1_i1.p1 TRINITY_DN21377_c0_g1~~TRINITY_DN21377_c0_g1_i1.p1  ORF type:complete len:115 (+),score=12.41 TRINITY_DN21377_c0_g1_i1:41-346(+)